ncbi:MAG: hypothetical protein JNJ56_02925 [Ignavibacteria bacterium]|nr:hypothetical protein [Ignavibacteria bacterium]
MKKLKTMLFLILITAVFVQQNSYSQNSVSRIKQGTEHKKAGIKIDRGTERKKISENKNREVKKFRGTYQMFEDFESGFFPPSGWSITYGDQEWAQSYLSAYGVGDYSAFYSSWNCYYDNNIMYSPSFGPTQYSDLLYFDFAYAPWDDGNYTYYDDMEIFYSDDYGNNWYSLVFINGIDLQTAPATNSYFYPANEEWAQYYTGLPEGTTNLYFQVYENCSNNIYLDNIKVTGFEIPETQLSVTAAYSKGRYPRNFLTNDTISANVSNLGNQAVSNLKVYMQMTGANNMFDSATITYLEGMDKYIVKFIPFTPILNGNSSIKIWVESFDNDPWNDTAYCVTNVNSNYLSYADTVLSNYNGTIGFYDHIVIMQKYRVTDANSRISEIRLKMPDFGTNPIGQRIKGILLDGNGMVVAKSDEYKVKASDIGNFVTLKLSNPHPYYPVASNSYFYAGGEFSDAFGDEYFWNLANQSEDPPRPDTYFLGLGGEKEIGETLYPYEFGNKFGIEVKLDNMPTVDAGISSLGNLYEQYYSTSNAAMTGSVYNNALSGTANATVIRKITPGSYTSSVPVSIPANSTMNVNFANFTFVSGTEYIVRDSIVLTGDVNLSNNVLSREFRPKIAKDMAVIYQKDEDKDSLIRAITTDGRYTSNYDLIDLNYKGSIRPWKIVFNCIKSSRIIKPLLRDSLKAYLDSSTPLNKKTLIVFGDDADQFDNVNSPADSIFFRQYLKSQFASGDWINGLSESGSKFKGKGFFSGVSQDSVSPPWFSTADLIEAVNGGTAAFVPKSVTGAGNDSAAAVCYAGTNYNSFYMSNRFSDLRSTYESPLDGPVLIYSKIIDWLQSLNSSSKILDLTVLLEGMYDTGSNTMTRDTVRVYLRNSSPPFAKVDSAKAYLSSAGQATVSFNNALNGVNYYIQIKHRNSIETWSGTAQMFTSNYMLYNFTNASNKAFGDNMKLMGTRWVIFTGDSEYDGIVDASDISMIESASSNSEEGYIQADLNNDLYTDATDLSMVENNAALGVSSVIPFASAVSPGNEVVNLFDKYGNNNTGSRNDNDIYERTKNFPQEKITDIIKRMQYLKTEDGRTEKKSLR